MPEIFAHFKLGYMYSTNTVKQSKLGFCALNLNSSIETILTLTEDELLPAGIATDQV